MRRLLLVDDNRVLASFLRTLIESKLSAVEVMLADSVDSAWEKFIRHTPRIIVLDIRLPDGDGFELRERMRAHCGGLSFILISAEPLSAARAVSAADIVGSLVKPFSSDELVALVDRITSQCGTSAPAVATMPGRDRIVQPSASDEFFWHLGRLQGALAALGGVGWAGGKPAKDQAAVQAQAARGLIEQAAALCDSVRDVRVLVTDPHALENCCASLLAGLHALVVELGQAPADHERTTTDYVGRLLTVVASLQAMRSVAEFT